jgi:hypothetical protein
MLLSPLISGIPEEECLPWRPGRFVVIRWSERLASSVGFCCSVPTTIRPKATLGTHYL